jgi:hypothetical protein
MERQPQIVTSYGAARMIDRPRVTRCDVAPTSALLTRTRDVNARAMVVADRARGLALRMEALAFKPSHRCT